MTGKDLIAAERRRQIEAEGWSAEHDRQHGSRALHHAALAYATGTSRYWPWDHKWWKPKGALRNLVRAGALYQAAADVATPGAYHSPEFYERERDWIAGLIDELLAEVRASSEQGLP